MTTEIRYKYVAAGWWRRFFSMFYEVLLLAAVLLLAQALGQALFQWSTGLPVTALSELVWARHLNFAWQMLFLFVYFAVCWRSGQTLAMKTWRMRLAGSDGHRPCWRQVLLRFVFACLFYGPALPLWVMAWHDRAWFPLAWAATAWLIAPFAWVAFDRDGQLLHDRFAGTRLLMTKGRPNKTEQQQTER